MVYTGTVDDICMTVSSTGMGGPQVAIGVEELAHLGADTFIRVGSCGTMRDDVQCGDVIVPTGMCRGGATAHHYLPPAFPAVPNFQVLTALVEAATQLDLKVHTGVGYSGDAFYSYITRPGIKLRQAKTVALEMEADTLFQSAVFMAGEPGPFSPY